MNTLTKAQQKKLIRAMKAAEKAMNLIDQLTKESDAFKYNPNNTGMINRATHVQSVLSYMCKEIEQ